jgi:hypothetical protein
VQNNLLPHFSPSPIGYAGVKAARFEVPNKPAGFADRKENATSSDFESVAIAKAADPVDARGNGHGNV